MFVFGIYEQSRSYLMLPNEHGDFAFIHQTIYEEMGPIDILFLGDSILWTGIDTAYVKETLKKHLGRETSVVTFGMDWGATDLAYSILTKLLKRREVRMIVMNMPTWDHSVKSKERHPASLLSRLRLGESAFHGLAGRYLQFGMDNDLVAGLNWIHRFEFYGLTVLAAPRQLLGTLRPEWVDTSVPYAMDLGARKARRGLWGQPFVEDNVDPPTIPVQQMEYSQETKGKFHFAQDPLSEIDALRLGQIGMLVNQKRIPLIIVHFPMIEDWLEGIENTVRSRLVWSEVLGINAPMLGIPGAELFEGFSRKRIENFFYNRHLNANGNRYFTKAITPAILVHYNEGHTI